MTLVKTTVGLIQEGYTFKEKLLKYNGRPFFLKDILNFLNIIGYIPIPKKLINEYLINKNSWLNNDYETTSKLREIFGDDNIKVLEE